MGGFKGFRGVLKRVWAVAAVSVLFWAAEGRTGTVDPFDIFVWDTFADTGASFVVQEASGSAGVYRQAKQLSYDLTSGGFVGIFRSLTPVDFLELGANAVRFSYRASGPVNSVEVKLTDNDLVAVGGRDDALDFKFLLTPDDVWREMVVPFTEFQTFEIPNSTQTEADYITEFFDPSAVTRLQVGLTRDNGNPGSGALYVDNLRLTREDAPRSLIDGFEADGVNLRRLSMEAFSSPTSAGSLVYVTTQTHGGARALEMNYTVGATGDFVAFVENLGGMMLPENGTETLEFWARGAFGGEKMRVELEDNANARGGTSVVTLDATLRPYTYSFSSIAPLLNQRGLEAVKFVFTDASCTPPCSGKVYIDDVAVIGPSGTRRDVLMLDDYSESAVYSFNAFTHTEAKLKLDYVIDPFAGMAVDNRVARLTYEFSASPDVPYAAIDRTIAPDLSVAPVVRLRYKGQGGNNTLELKVKDSDGTQFVRKIKSATNTNDQWKTLLMPIQRFEQDAAGTAGGLNLRALKELTLAISKQEATAGTFVLDDLSFVAEEDFQKDTGGGVLTRVATPNNPFSPNGDGVKDEALFNYTLAEAARITLFIYDTRGGLVRRMEAPGSGATPGVVEAGVRSLVWDGLDRDGRRVPNGVFFYSLVAEALSGNKEKYKQLIGVAR